MTDLTMNATITIVGESASHSPIASTLNTYPSRVPVQAGDLLGEYLDSSGLVGCSREDDAYTDHYLDSADVSPGTSDTFTVENFQQDISAVLEPDADHDGFGDETQDQCSSNGATQGPCAVTQVKNKCHNHKKKHKRPAESAKKKHKKCKKHKKRK